MIESLKDIQVHITLVYNVFKLMSVNSTYTVHIWCQQ